MKSNAESEENIQSVVKSLNNFDKMIRFWLNKTASEESYENEFDWKRKKLKEFLNHKWYIFVIFIIKWGECDYNSNPMARAKMLIQPSRAQSITISDQRLPSISFFLPLIHQRDGVGCGGVFVKFSYWQCLGLSVARPPWLPTTWLGVWPLETQGLENDSADCLQSGSVVPFYCRMICI